MESTIHIGLIDNSKLLREALAARLATEAAMAIMLAALRSPASLIRVCSPQLLAATANEIQFRHRRMPSDRQYQANSLTGRERQVAERAAGGLINKHIAKQLGIGITTRSKRTSAVRCGSLRFETEAKSSKALAKANPGVSHPANHCATA